jgi:hypothetical protein
MTRDKMIEALAREIEVTMNAHRDLDDMSDVIAAAVLDLCAPVLPPWLADGDSWTAGPYEVLGDNAGYELHYWQIVQGEPHLTLHDAFEAGKSHAVETWLKLTPLGKLVEVV